MPSPRRLSVPATGCALLNDRTQCVGGLRKNSYTPPIPPIAAQKLAREHELLISSEYLRKRDSSHITKTRQHTYLFFNSSAVLKKYSALLSRNGRTKTKNNLKQINNSYLNSNRNQRYYTLDRIAKTDNRNTCHNRSLLSPHRSLLLPLYCPFLSLLCHIDIGRGIKAPKTISCNNNPASFSRDDQSAVHCPFRVTGACLS